jgi:hypothetical protein
MLNVKPVSGSVSVGDTVTDAGMISGVDHQPIATSFTLNVDAPFVEPEFMPEYDAALGMSGLRIQPMIDLFLS